MISKIYSEDIIAILKFTDECIGLPGEIEECIQQLDMHSEGLDLNDKISSLVRKIKRGSSFFGLSALTRVTYEMEFNLEAIQRREKTVRGKHIDSLLMGVNFLNIHMKRLYQCLQDYRLHSDRMEPHIEFATNAEEDLILDDLELNHKSYDYEKREEECGQNKTLDEEDCFDILLSEKFSEQLSEDIREQFLYENAEYLDMVENNILVRLDNNKNDLEAVNEIFRVIHSMKGGAGVFLASLSRDEACYNDVKKYMDLVHSFEGLLSLLRDEKCSFENKYVDLSLRIIDYLKSLIRAVELNEVFSESDDQGLLNTINQEIQNIQSMPTGRGQDNRIMPEREGNKSEDNKAKGSITQSIRVHQDKIDKLMNLISELIIAKNSFTHISNRLNIEYNLPEISKEVRQVGAYVNRISDELENSIMSIRMVEIRTVFQKMSRVVRDIAMNNGKRIELIMEGEDTEIDKSIIELISDPLVHIIRNSADHGIEEVRERLDKNKPQIGRITLRAYNKNNYVYIEVEDDGKGINPQIIKMKAIEKGIITEQEAEKMNHNQLINLIFLPGFSTAEKVTEVSGRGVGMDIVRSNIVKIKGSIAVESEVDKGTKMIIRLPLSLAVSRGLIVEVSGDNFIIPLDNIVETVKIGTKNIHKYNDKYFTYLRGNVIGIEWLSKIFQLGDRDREKELLYAVILSDGVENFALIVDRLKNEQEFVMKPLEGHLSAIPGISGSTLLGNGQVVLVINPMDLMKLAGS